MPSGLHFIAGIPLIGSLSLTASDIDTSTVAIRLASNRYIGIFKDTPPDSSDSPDWQRLLWIRPFELGGPQVWVYDGSDFVQTTAIIDLSQATPNTLPVESLYAGSPASIGQIVAIIGTVDGPRAAFIDIPAPYPIGANGTAVFSNGTVGAFRLIQGIDIRSAAAGSNIYPLMSDGSGLSAFVRLPPASIVLPTGADPVKLMVSRANGAYASTILNLIELRADTDLIGTHVTVGYIPKAIADGNIQWVNPNTLETPYYQSPSPVPLSSVPSITLGDYATITLDTISWTLQKPVVVQVYLECTSTDQGYLANDRISLDSIIASDGSRSASYRVSYSGFTATVKATLYGIYVEDANAASGTISNVLLDNTKWRFVVTTQKI